MDASLPSYEAAMREAREYLRRRDLSSKDEIPLYFAWQRLYTAANANLSTDFLHETRAELHARQQARLAPRRGLPPPLFTSFDKVNRKSAQASAFLRSGTSSDAAIEMMARRYRREAEKLRSSRERLGEGLDTTGKRLKKGKRRQKSPEQEVEELLEVFEQSKRATENQVHDLDGAPMTTTKGDLKFTNGKNAFAEELARDPNATKAEELRKSSFSTGSLTMDPILSNVANVAAFAAQVSDWRVSPADTEPTSPQLLTEKVAAPANATELRSMPRSLERLEGSEANITFDSTLGSSGSEGGSLELENSLRTRNLSASPTNERRANDEKDNNYGEYTVPSPKNLSGQRRSNPDKALPVQSSYNGAIDPSPAHTREDRRSESGELASSSLLHHKLQQLSHAVGDMQLKIKGNEIEVTFKGALNTEDVRTSTEDSHGHDSSTMQLSATQKVFNTVEQNNRESNDKYDVEVSQTAPLERRGRNSGDFPRKQSSVRFADIADSDTNDDGEIHQELSSREAMRKNSEPEELRNASAASLPAPQQQYVHGIVQNDRDPVDIHDEESKEERNEQEEVRDYHPSIEHEIGDGNFDHFHSSICDRTDNHSVAGLMEGSHNVRTSSVVRRREELMRPDQSFHASSYQLKNTQPSVSSLVNDENAGKQTDCCEEKHQEHKETGFSEHQPRRRKHDQESLQQQSLGNVDQNSASRKRQSGTVSGESRISRSRKNSLKSDDGESEERMGDARESSDAASQSRKNYRSSNIPVNNHHRVSRKKDRDMSSRKLSLGETSATETRGRRRDYSSRQSRNQKDEIPSSELSSDEDFSDGPDTPDFKRYHRRQSNHSSVRLQTPISQANHKRNRKSSRPASAWETHSFSKRRSSSPDSSDDYSYSSYDSRDDYLSDSHRRSATGHSRSDHPRKSRPHQQRSVRCNVYEQDYHLPAEMEFPPIQISTDGRSKRGSKVRNETKRHLPRSKPSKLPEGIVWPPGMEVECIARLGLDGHHPIAPPGLEHLVTKEQWGDYWTWLHWYSSWQMWYMKNGKKSRHKSTKEKRTENRHENDDGHPDIKSEQKSRSSPCNANWWLDVGPSKHGCRSSRHERVK
ncbi:unnamed protein product [Phytophthora lilii]|uniref:Unnamed protein product n=1 Tax=Phytophthora lilii TaxID=2077276 RepID=A0A9W6XKX8_9STRA|nr:unnamed protein product [Phytophthora lilii]